MWNGKDKIRWHVLTAGEFDRHSHSGRFQIDPRSQKKICVAENYRVLEQVEREYKIGNWLMSLNFEEE
jgi:hypothetical protein